MKKLIVAFLSAVVSVPVLLAGCDGKSEEEKASEKLVEACKKVCDALTAANCPEFTGGSTCKSACPYLEDQLDGYCVAEYADAYDCLGSLSYTCMMGYPFPSDPTACIDEQQALSQCSQGLTCKKFCGAAQDAGCGGISEDACVQDCEAGRPSELACDFDYERLRECQTENMTCQGGRPSAAGCEDEKADIVDCFASWGDGDPCSGYCFFAQEEGCATGGAAACKSDCLAALTQDPPGAEGCSYDFDYVRSCEAKGLVCNGGKPVVNDECVEEKKQAAGCLSTFGDACLGACWLAEARGCNKEDLAACQSSCQAQKNSVPNCSYQYDYLQECKINQNIVCDTDPGDACQYEQDSYQQCVATQN